MTVGTPTRLGVSFALTSLSLLTICGLSELGGHSSSAVTHVLSILDPEWPDPEDFGRYRPHHRTILKFHDAIEPGPGLSLPTPDHVAAVLAFGQALNTTEPAADPHVLVHCHMGVSRSTAAMATLIAQASPGLDEDGVFQRLFDVRAQAWPNSRMIAFADEQLARRGRFTAALARFYARQLVRSPEIADFMTANHRIREVEMARAAKPRP